MIVVISDTMTGRNTDRLAVVRGWVIAGGAERVEPRILLSWLLKCLAKSSAVCQHEMDFGASRRRLFTFDHNSLKSRRLALIVDVQYSLYLSLGNSEGNETAFQAARCDGVWY